MYNDFADKGTVTVWLWSSDQPFSVFYAGSILALQECILALSWVHSMPCVDRVLCSLIALFLLSVTIS